MLFSLLFFVSSAFAQISKDEMLKRIEKDTASFQRAPLYPLPQELTDKMVERTKARYPKFKESMWYYNYVLDKGYYNIVFYDWTAEECQYFVFSEEALKKRDSAVQDFMRDPEKNGNAKAKRERIPTRVCEKLYNFYSGKKD